MGRGVCDSADATLLGTKTKFREEVLEQGVEERRGKLR